MISSISFGNKIQYVHESTMFAKKEIEQAAKAVKEALERDFVHRVISHEPTAAERFARPDAPIVIPAADTSRELSYVISHGNPADAHTIAII